MAFLSLSTPYMLFLTILINSSLLSLSFDFRCLFIMRLNDSTKKTPEPQDGSKI